jgi:tryptophanyl-tRNA synthetase
MRYLSGIQPSGIQHLGNYFGAMRQHIARQEEHESYFFVADYHALTSVTEPDKLRGYVRDLVLDYLAVGLDPEKVALFRQSDVPEVTELMWILSTVTGMGLMERGHSYKDKTAKGLSPNLALFSYPVLMAADILLYDAERVPVGNDQVQHLEVTRDIAQSFNHKFGEVFVLPEGEYDEVAAIVPGTDGQKMSKSYGNTICMFDSKKSIKKSIMTDIVTDSKTVEEPKDPDTNTIYQLYRLVASNEELLEMADRMRAGGYGYGDAKKALLERLLEYFGPFRERREKLEKQPDIVEQTLAVGAEKASKTARATMDRVRRAVGLA